nr:dsRBD fold-containing protein [Tetrasphaera sp. HKS02]
MALVADPPGELTGRGATHRSVRDADDPRIGDEVAVARALRHLADDLLARATHDIEAATGEVDIVVRSR